MTTAHDPLAINSRLYKQIGRLLDDLEAADVKETLDIKERIAALIAIGRIQTIFVALRKEDFGGSARSGASVRKYSRAFSKKDAGGGRATSKRARAGAAAELASDDFGDDGDDAG